MIIDTHASRRFFGDHDPIGRSLPIGLADESRPPVTVVGVVGDVKYSGLDAAPDGAIYRPLVQQPVSTAFIVARTIGDQPDAVSVLRQAVTGVDPNVAVVFIQSLDEIVGNAAARPRFRATLLATLTAIALILAAAGLYGALAVSVSRRTREIGIRLALGARPRAVTGLVFRQAMMLVAIGVVVGAVGALAASRYLEAMLFGVTPFDPGTLLMSVVFLSAVAAAATYGPARRGTRVDPLVALRAE